MLNPFPLFLNYPLFGPTLLRVVLAAYVIWLGFIKFSPIVMVKTVHFFESMGFRPGLVYAKLLGVGEIVIGFLLLIGLLTQIDSIITLIISVVALVVSVRHKEVGLREPGVYIFIIAICISLLFLGAGFFAADLPL